MDMTTSTSRNKFIIGWTGKMYCCGQSSFNHFLCPNL